MEERIRDILREVRQIEIESKKVVNTLFGGEYKSSFKVKEWNFMKFVTTLSVTT